jgi:hypothetical protein
VFIVSASQIKFLSEGIDARKFFNFAATDKVLIAALPEYETFIKEHSHVAYGQLIDVLTQKILLELRNTLAGKEQDSESVRRAMDILKASDEANEAMAKREIAVPPGVSAQ